MSEGALSFKVTYNPHQAKIVDRFIKAYPELVTKAVRQTTDFAKKSIIEKTPVKTGAARASWIIEEQGPFTYAIISAVGRGRKYTPFLETGTGIWREGGSPITPKHGEFLVFPIIVGNTIVRWVKKRSVNGMAGHFMIARTKKPATEKLVNLLQRAIRSAWGKR